MPRPRKIQTPPEATSQGRPGSSGGLRLLVVAPDRKTAARLARQATHAIAGAECGQACSLSVARGLISEKMPDVVLIDSAWPQDGAFELASELSGSACASVMLSEEPTFDLAMRAMRAGAAEMLPLKVPDAELAASLGRALDRSRLVRRREERIVRLSRICRHLNESRRQVSSQVSGLCGDMINAFQEMADQVCQITIAAEFNGLIRQELEIENLLRTGLEYILAKCGSTNAAVFLPSGSHDFSLGAYVNYDCPKDALDMMLEHLVGIVAPRMQDETDLKVLADEYDMAELLGQDAHWLADCTAAAFSCRHEGECLAVVLLFRDRRNPFSEAALSTLKIISDVFAQQLARVVRVHHRHLPKDQWGGLGMADDADDDIDLAA
jgi:FixJ family two-component response regulator